MKSRRAGSLRRLDALEKEWDTGRRSILEIAPCTRWQDFCGNTEIPDDLKEREPQRAALYKATAALVRAFANIAGELEAAGYTQPKIGRIKQAIDRHVKLREIIRNASGESLDRHAGAPRPLQQPQPRPGLGPDQAAAKEDEGAGARNASRVPGPGKPLRLGKAVSAEGDRERRGAGSGVKAQPNASSDSPGKRRREETSRPRRMVSGATQGSSPSVGREMGAAHGRQGGAVLCAEDENQMG